MNTLNRRSILALAAAATATAAAAPAFAQTATDAPAEAAVVEVKDFSIGNPDAPIKMVEYASYTCPHCASFHSTTFKPLKAEYIDTGKVHFTLKEVYFDRYGLWAALVARCGGDMKYFGISDMLFAQQSDWATLSDPTAVVGKLRTIGLTAGLTNEQLDACLSDAPMVDALVKHFEAGMADDNVTGTPTLFINGKKHANMSFADLKAILDEELPG